MAKYENSSARKSTSYVTDFREFCRIGGGGQGSVYKAVHILDGKDYAVKKVRFKKSREAELLREVKALSNLTHANIIRYHTSWTEDGELSDEEEEESIVFSSDTPSRDSIQSKSKESPRILYIQMELCMSTLRQWIDHRNETVSDTRALVYDKRCIMDVMRQILSGVEFIHKEQLIHRDLKPENILHTENNIFKIGDFGLAKLNVVNEEAADNLGQYQVGTVPYRAPETEYNTKSDMYSVGVIMLEMCYKMNTTREKVEVIKKLCKGEVPKELKTNGWKNQRNALRQMVQTKVEERPSASDLINGPLFLTEEQELKILRERVKVLEKQVDNLKAKLQHATLHGPATMYKPPSTKSKVRRLTQKLSIERKRVRLLTLQLTELHAEFLTPDLEVGSPAMLASVLTRHGATFRSKKEKDCFHRLCRGITILYRKFHLDVCTLVCFEILNMGMRRLDEVGGAAWLERLVMSCVSVANDLNTNDPSWFLNQFLFDQHMTNFLSSGEYKNLKKMDGQKQSTGNKKIRRRKSREKTKSAGAPALTFTE